MKEWDMSKWPEGTLIPNSKYYQDGFVCSRCGQIFDDFPNMLINELPCGCHDDPKFGHVISGDCPEHD